MVMEAEARQRPRDIAIEKIARRSSRVAAWVEAHPFLAIGCLATTARLLVAVASFVLDADVLFGDEFQYLSFARWLSLGGDIDGWQPGYSGSLFETTKGFLVPLAWLFDVFWPARIFGQLIAVLFGVLTVLLVTWMTDRLVGRRWALLAGALSAVLPSQVLFSSVALRESEVWAAYALVCAGVVALVSDRRASLLTAIIAWTAGLLLLGVTRDQTLLAAAWPLPIAVALTARRQRLAATAASLGLVAMIPVLGGIGPFGWDLVEETLPGLGTIRTYMSLEADSSFTSTTIVAAPTTIPEVTTTTPAGGAPGETPSTTLEFGVPVPTGDGHTLVKGYRGEVYLVDDTVRGSISALLPGTIAVLARPLPWDAISSATLGLAMLENLVWFFLYVLAVVGVLVGVRDRRFVLAYPLMSAGAIVVAAALTQGNVGTAFRHRGQVLWVVVLLAAVGAAELARRRAAGASRSAAASIGGSTS